MTSAIWLQSKFTVTKKHVYAHQDKILNVKYLTMESTLNCKVDSLAKTFALEQIYSKKINHFKHTSLVLGTITCAGQLVSSKIQNTLYNIIMNGKLIQKHSKRMGLPVATLNSIVCWEVMNKARKEVALILKIHTTRWVSGETATVTVMVQ